MFEVDLSSKKLTQTFMGYGNSRAGKTRFFATFPRPLFLSDATENGWETIANMSDEHFFEPGVKPIVWGINQMNDMSKALGSIGSEQVAGMIDPLIKSGQVLSIFVDSITFYADLFLNGVIAGQKQYDARGAYGQLGNHLRDLRVKAHSKGTNVGWLALAKHPESAQVDKEGNITQPSSPGGPMIPGQQGDKFAAGVQALWFFRKTYNAGEKNPPTYEIRTQPWNKYAAGNRLGDFADKMPNPMVGDYSTYLGHIGRDADEVRQNLPKINNAVTVSMVTKPATPPVGATPPKPKVVSATPMPTVRMVGK